MKLAGQRYWDHWANRMAMGALQAGHAGDGEDQVEAQADAYEAAIRHAGAGVDRPRTVLEYGCGWGRMLRRLRRIWPEAELYGVELSPAAAKAAWRDERTTVFNSTTPPAYLPPIEALVTVTCLQHITDELVFGDVVAKLDALLINNALVVLLENVSSPGAPHVRDMTAADYRAVFPRVRWFHDGKVSWRDQEHCVLAGRVA